MVNQPPCRCDIIIPVWNNPEITLRCVESIRRNTHYPFRLIVIDNASDDPARTMLRDLRDDGMVLMRNEENLGFIKAVNQGMRYSDAEYVCILNNDVIVTSGWLEETIAVLSGNPDIGVANPSSNTSCQFPGNEGIDAYAVKLRELSGQYQELYRARGFAMVIKREVIGKIGYLDERYGAGYFDDTDYSKRAQASGYKTVRAKAAYVFHLENRSFNKVKETPEIFRENEKKFNAIWGRHMRIGYVIPRLADAGDASWASRVIIRIARIGHQVLVFAPGEVLKNITTQDHESIRPIACSRYFFVMGAAFRIWKRMGKKNIDILVVRGERSLTYFRAFSKVLGCSVISDKDMDAVSDLINKVSFT